MLLQNDLHSFEAERTLKVPTFFYLLVFSLLYLVSCLELIQSHLLSGKNSFVCLRLSIGKEKSGLLCHAVSCCFYNGTFSRYQRKGDGEVQLVQQNPFLAH